MPFKKCGSRNLSKKVKDALVKRILQERAKNKEEKKAKSNNGIVNAEQKKYEEKETQTEMEQTEKEKESPKEILKLDIIPSCSPKVQNNNSSEINENDFADDNAQEILENFHNIINNQEGLNNAAEILVNELVDDSIFGVLLEMHLLTKTGQIIAMEGINPENPDSRIQDSLKVDKPNYDIFGVKIAEKPMECTCPNCDSLVLATRFAQHLEKCMARLSSKDNIYTY